MTLSNGNKFCVTGPLCGEFTGHRWIPLTKASDGELAYFVCSAPNKRLSKQTTRYNAYYDVIVVFYKQVMDRDRNMIITQFRDYLIQCWSQKQK